MHWIGILLLTAADQAAKWLALAQLTESYQLTSWARLDLAFNTGIAFSWPIARIIPLLVALGVLAYGAYEFTNTRLSKTARWGWIGLLGGTLGNLLDRFFRGAVVDFVSLWSFPIFNLADVFISLGVLAIIWSEMRD